MADQFEQLLIKVRMQGGAATKAELLSTAGAVKALGDAAEVTGKKTAFAAEKAFLFGEEMYSLKRYVFFAQTALALTGFEVLKMGFEFDEAKSKGVGALKAITGSASVARSEIGKLIALTHTSGLSLSSLTGSAEQMLNFGFSIATTNRYLAAFANFSGKLGLGAAGVSSLTGLFSTVQGTGFLTERQLKAFSGITGLSGNLIAEQGLHLSAGQAYSLIHGQLQIGASTALPLLATYLQSYAARQPSNLSQEFGIAKGYLAQIMGAAGLPVFNWLDKQGASLTGKGGLLARITAGGQPGGGGILKALDPSGTLTNAWRTLTGTARLLGDTLKNMWTVAKPVVGVLLLLSSTVLALTSHTLALKLILEPLIALYIVHRTMLLLNIAATKAQTFWTWAAAGATKLYEFWVLRAEYAQLLQTRATTILTGATNASSGALELLAGRTEAASFSMLGVFGGMAGIAGKLGTVGLSLVALNLLINGNRYDKKDTWSTHGITHAFGDTFTGFLGGKWINRDISAALGHKAHPSQHQIQVVVHHTTVLDGNKVAESTSHAKAKVQARA